MNRLFVALPVLLCIAGVASSQSLADIANKEKQRRKENAEQGNKTVLEAAGVGSFGHVWWRPDDVATSEGPRVEDATTAPSAKFDSEAAPAKTSSATSEAAAETTTTNGTRSKRGELPLRKSSGRRRR